MRGRHPLASPLYGWRKSFLLQSSGAGFPFKRVRSSIGMSCQDIVILFGFLLYFFCHVCNIKVCVESMVWKSLYLGQFPNKWTLSEYSVFINNYINTLFESVNSKIWRGKREYVKYRIFSTGGICCSFSVIVLTVVLWPTTEGREHGARISR